MTEWTIRNFACTAEGGGDAGGRGDDGIAVIDDGLWAGLRTGLLRVKRSSVLGEQIAIMLWVGMQQHADTSKSPADLEVNLSLCSTSKHY